MMMMMMMMISRRASASGSCPGVCRSLSADARPPSYDGRSLLGGVSSEPPAAPSPSACGSTSSLDHFMITSTLI